MVGISRKSNVGYSDIPRFIANRFFYPDTVVLLDADAQTLVERRFVRSAARSSRRQFDDREAALERARAPILGQYAWEQVIPLWERVLTGDPVRSTRPAAEAMGEVGQ
jgi:hypothetical protein